MRRTRKPRERKNIKKQDIILDITEEQNSLFVNMEFKNVSDYKFPEKSKIYLEAYNKQDIDHIDLGEIQSFSGKIKEKLPSFEVPARSKIKFRLKVVDTKYWYLLGLSEKLKERKYAQSLLNLRTKSNINTSFEIDWVETDHPELIVNHELRECLTDIKSLLAEVIFREILHGLLFFFQEECNEDNLKDHKWIQFASKYKTYHTNLKDSESKKEWIDDVISAFSKNHKAVKKLKQKLRKD